MQLGPDSISSLASSPSGRLLAVGDSAGRVSVVDVAARGVLYEMLIQLGGIFTGADHVWFDVDESCIVALLSSGHLLRWTYTQGAGSFRDTGRVAVGADFSTWLGSTCILDDQKTVTVWGSTGELEREIRVDRQGASVAIASEGQIIAVGDSAGVSATLFDREEWRRINVTAAPVKILASTRRGTGLLYGNEQELGFALNHGVEADTRRHRTDNEYRTCPLCLAVSPDGGLGFAGFIGARGKMYDVHGMFQVCDEIAFQSEPEAAEFTTEGSLVIGGRDGSITFLSDRQII